MRIRQNNILKLLTCGLLLGGLTSCSDIYDDLESSKLDSKSHIVLTFVTPNDGTSTRSAAEDPDGYEDGIEYESTVNIEEGDYKIYFFTYASGDTNGGTLITEFEPTEISSAKTNTTTTYTMVGDVPPALLNKNDFRVVMLANWGSYPSITVGETTIDNLCDGTNTTYSASSKFDINANNLIPFYGVQEYNGISFINGTVTTLTTPVSLLRALAKVEVILTADSDVEEFDNVSIVNYNAQGYCAPWQVYTASDYDTNTSKNPDTALWPDEWVTDLHLVGNANDTETKTQAFTQVSGTTQDTWRIYLPEYNNMSEDYSYITLTIDGETYNVYFADYSDGTTTAYDELEEGTESSTTGRLNLKRNNLYRYYVTLKNRELRVFVETWENVFDNEWKFGEYSHLIYADDDINNFTDENGYIYASLVVEGNEDDEKNPTVYLQKVDNSSITTTGYVSIPETVTYLGYTYTVVQIGNYCFEADENVTSIEIPSTITYIGTDAFHNDLSLVSITIHCETPPECASDAFEGDDLEKIILYVPTNSLEEYQKTSPWSGFGTIEGIDF